MDVTFTLSTIKTTVQQIAFGWPKLPQKHDFIDFVKYTAHVEKINPMKLPVIMVCCTEITVAKSRKQHLINQSWQMHQELQNNNQSPICFHLIIIVGIYYTGMHADAVLPLIVFTASYLRTNSKPVYGLISIFQNSNLPYFEKSHRKSEGFGPHLSYQSINLFGTRFISLYLGGVAIFGRNLWTACLFEVSQDPFESNVHTHGVSLRQTMDSITLIKVLWQMFKYWGNSTQGQLLVYKDYPVVINFRIVKRSSKNNYRLSLQPFFIFLNDATPVIFFFHENNVEGVNRLSWFISP